MNYTVLTETDGDTTTARYAPEIADEALDVSSTAEVTRSVDEDHPLARFDPGFVTVALDGLSGVTALTLNDVDGRVLAAALTAHYAALDAG